jgi:anti-sigma factor RsiW
MIMDCTQTRTLIHGYLDQELDPANTIALDAHAASCAACKRMLDRQLALKSAVREHAAYHAAPAALAERIRAQLGNAVAVTSDKTGERRWLQPRPWFQLGAAVAVTAVVTWTAALQLNMPSRDQVIAEQVIAGHARSVVTEHLTDVASSDQHTVKPWISGRLDFSPPVRDLTPAGFALAGGRLDYLDNRPVAALVYRHRQHVVDLFVWPAAPPHSATAVRAFSRQGYEVLHWTDGNMTYWAISDLNPADLRTFVDAYSNAK